MTNETATATAEANWEAARIVWEKATAYRLDRWLTGGNVLGHLDHAVNIAENAMTEAHDDAFVAAEDRKRNWAI